MTNTRTGQCHRYSEYERSPIATSHGVRSTARSAASGSVDHDRDDHRAQHREHEEAAAVQRRACDRRRRASSRGSRPAPPPRARGATRAARRVRAHPAGERLPRARPRPRAPRARRRRAGPSRASRCRGTRATGRRSARTSTAIHTVDATAPTSATAAARTGWRTIDAPRREEHEREHDVELLLDRERPHVQERRRPARAREVVALREDDHPVRAVEERAERLGADVVHLRVRELIAAAISTTTVTVPSAGSSRRARRAQKLPQRHRARPRDLARRRAGR